MHDWKAQVWRSSRCALLACVGAGWLGGASAQSWGGSLGLASDNLYRGLSLTDDRPAWLADVHYEIDSAWLLGVGASTSHPRGETPGAQLALYLDRRWQLDENWSAKLGVVHYDWPGSRWRDELSYDEWNAALGYAGRWTATISISPDATGIYSEEHSRTGFAAAAELTFHQPLAGRLAADVGVGYADRARIGDYDYRYGSIGLSYGIGDAYLFASRVWTSKVDADYWWEGYADMPSAQSHWAVSLVWSF